jgi:DNA polymerase III alpha subunit
MLMKTDELGIPRFSNRDLINMIYSGHADKMHAVLCEKETNTEKFNNALVENGLDPLNWYVPIVVDVSEFDSVCQTHWLMPDEYKNIDVWKYLIKKCEEKGHWPDNISRITAEYREFESRKMLHLLQYMIYLVDFMRENDIVWGVGRGSSVASYVLYLIGVHRIDSVQYDLDWTEFLR